MAVAIVAATVVLISASSWVVWGKTSDSRRRRAAAEVVVRLSEPERQHAQLRNAAALVAVADRAAGNISTFVTNLADSLLSESASSTAGELAQEQLEPLLALLTRFDSAAAQTASRASRLGQPAEPASAPGSDALVSVLRAAEVPDHVLQIAASIYASMYEHDGAGLPDDIGDLLGEYPAGGMGRVEANTSPSGAHSQTEPGQPESPLADQAHDLVDRASRCGPAKQELLAVMAELGLDVESPKLRGWDGYVKLLAGYEGRCRDAARELAGEVRACIVRELGENALADELPSEGLSATPAMPTELSQAVDGLLTSAERYATAVASLVAKAGMTGPADRRPVNAASEADGDAGEAPAAPEDPWQKLDAVPAVLAHCRQELRDGNARSALGTLATVTLPVAGSWGPSREYEEACADAARRFGDIASAECKRAARAFGEQAADFGIRADRIAETVRRQLVAWASRRDEIWNELRDAAQGVQREAARALVSKKARRDASLPIEAAGAMLGIQELTAAGLSNAARRAMPVTAEIVESRTENPRQYQVAHIIKPFERAGVMMAGVDGVLSPLLLAKDAHAAAALSAAMRRFAPVPDDVHRAIGDLSKHTHHVEAGLPTAAMSVIKYAQHHVVPHIPHLVTDHGFVSFLTSAVDAGTALSGIAEVFGPDGSIAGFGADIVRDAFVTDWIEKASHSSPLSYLTNPVDHVADHVGHATAHAAPAVLHGVVAHVPWVTLVISATREIRIHREYQTSLDDAVKSVALDVGSVAGAIFGAHLLAHALGLHAALVTVPVAIGARLATRQARIKALEEAYASYETISANRKAKFADLERGLETSLRSAADRERSAYLSSIGRPEPLSLTAGTQLGGIVRALGAATAAYAQRVRALLNAEKSLPGNGIAADARRAALAALDAVPQTLARSEQQLKDKRPVEALMTMAAVRLPVTDAWPAGRAYQETCQQTVKRLRTLEDEHWRHVAMWATGACAKFGMSEEKLAAQANTAIGAFEADVSKLKSELATAAKVVDVRSAQLHGHKKQ